MQKNKKNMDDVYHKKQKTYKFKSSLQFYLFTRTSSDEASSIHEKA
jgi:hypothetical protein